MTIFVSYTRADEAMVRALREDLDRMGEQVWLDQEIHGGELWWREIIRTIRSAEVFVFALSQASWRSLPCRQEFEYAHALGLPVLPVQVGPLDNLRIPIMERQLVDYRRRDADAVVHLVAALTELRARPVVLPNPLPPPPPVPFEYLYRIAELLGPGQIPPDRQEHIVSQLRRHLKTEEDEVARADIVKLLREFRERGEITRNNLREIDEILEGLGSVRPEEPEGGVTRLPATDHWRRGAGERPAPEPEPSRPAGERTAEPAAEPTGEPAGESTGEPGGESAREPAEGSTGEPAGPVAPAEPAEPGPEAARPRAEAPTTWRPSPATPSTPPGNTGGTGSTGATKPGTGAAPEWLRGHVPTGAPTRRNPPVVRGDVTRPEEARQEKTAAEWWSGEQSQSGRTPPQSEQQPERQSGALAFAGAVLGALGLPLFALAPTSDGGSDASAAVTALLILTGLGLSLTAVAVKRGEARAKAGVAIALVGLVGVLVYASSTGFFG